jgi:hypothetical protein
MEFNCSDSPDVLFKLNNNTGTLLAPDNWLDDGTGVAGPGRDSNIAGIVGV